MLLVMVVLVLLLLVPSRKRETVVGEKRVKKRVGFVWFLFLIIIH